MNIDILKKNIEQVISQPCFSAYSSSPSCMKPNGLSEDGTYIMVKVYPDDTSWRCRLIDGYVEEILEHLPEKYRDKLVTLKHDVNWVSYSYLPVFDTDTQAEWDKEFEDFVQAKSRWCREFGCD